MRSFLAPLFVFALVVPGVRAADPRPLDPRGLPGPLVIAGNAKKLPTDVRDAFFSLAGGDKARIVVLCRDEKTGRAAADHWSDLKPRSTTLLRAAERKMADDAKFAGPLTEATAVWLAGADAGALLKMYGGTLVEKEVRKLHARGGAIGAAGGCNAILGGRVGSASGCGFLPGFVIGERAETIPAHVGIACAGDAGIVIRGRVARVIGESPIHLSFAKGAGKPAAHEEYKAGSLLDLVQLQRAAFNRAAKKPFPPAKPPAPVVPKGALVIVGGGGASADIWKRFIELAGGPDSTIVVVTTAMPDPLPPESIEEKILKKYGARHVVALHTRDRKEADSPKFSAVLTRAKGVWFSGGRQWRFVDSYEGTLTEKRFHEVLARGGVIGGSSAGASIQSEFMPRGHPLGNTVMAAEGYEHGFGFLPGCAVDQHFFARKRTRDMTGLMKDYPQYLGIGIDEGTAIIVTGSTAEVMGKSKVAFYDAKTKPTGAKDYEEVFPSEKYDLKARRKAARSGQ